MRRFLDWTTRHVLLIAILFDFIIVVGGIWSLQRYNEQNIQRAKEQVAAEAEHRADDLAASQLDVCKRAVTAVTDQLNADLLKITTSFTSEGKPKPAWAVQLEFILTNRQPPLAACVPKENP